MKKRIYSAPGIKVRKVDGEEMLAGSGTISIGISDKPATGGGRAKDNVFTTGDDQTPSTNSDIWGD